MRFGLIIQLFYDGLGDWFPYAKTVIGTVMAALILIGITIYGIRNKIFSRRKSQKSGIV